MAHHKVKSGFSKINTDTTCDFWEVECDSYTGTWVSIPDNPYTPKPISVHIDDHSVEDLMSTRKRIYRKTRSIYESVTPLYKFVLQRNTHISFEKYILNNYNEIIEYNGQISFVKKFNLVEFSYV